MSLSSTIAFFALIMVVNGNWLAAAVKPAMLAIGTLMAAFVVDHPEIDVLNFQSFNNNEGRMTELKNSTKIKGSKDSEKHIDDVDKENSEFTAEDRKRW